jgi:transposase
VLVTRHSRYACRRSSGALVQAHAPEWVVPGLRTEALIAQVIVFKFGGHLPFYCQAGSTIGRGLGSTGRPWGNWVGRAGFHLSPVALMKLSNSASHPR